MTWIFSSESPTCPATRAKTVRWAWGAWLVIQIVSFPVVASKSATHPQVSMDATRMRGR